MTDRATTQAPAPWHLWVVGGILVVWYGITCADYILTIPPADAYLRLSMTEAEIALFKQEPLSTWIVWAGGVWPNFIGALLLLLRRRQAMWGFAVGLPFDIFNYAGIVLSGNFLNYGYWGLIWMHGMLGGALLGFFYARAQARRGVLR